MRKASLFALAAMAAAGFAGIDAPAGHNARAQVGEAATAQAQHKAPGQQAPGDTKATRQAVRYARWARAPRGKRYSASVRQHQRHAAKARRRQAERRRSR